MTADAVGGVWTYCLELADALAPHGIDVTLAVMGPPPGRGQLAELERSAARAELRQYALEWMEDPWQEVEEAEGWLLDLAGRTGADLVHLNGYAHASAPWQAPVVVAAHSDVLSWHRAVRGAPAGPEWEPYRKAVMRGLAAADLLVAPTSAVLADLRRQYAPRSPAVVIPNGIERHIPPAAKRDVVLAAGRVWDEAKNLAALARLAPRLPWPVLVAGEGNLGAGVQALGRLERNKLDRCLAEAAIFAAPARYEPFGLSALEAARSGCALVLGDLPSQHELWEDAAVFVDPFDEAALERALRSLIADPERRALLAGRARVRSLQYTAEYMAGGYVAGYARAAGRRTVEAA